MRRILIESARRKRAERHGGGSRRVTWQEVIDPTVLSPDDLLDLDQALTAFEQVDPTKATLVRLRFFAGLDEAQAAEALGISRPTASRHWAFARAWLIDRLKKSENS